MRPLDRTFGPRIMGGCCSWGDAPGCLGAAPLVLTTGSIPHISFIKRDVVAFEKCPVFILKRFLAVVFALVGDVLAHGFDIGSGNGEGSVSGLPCECGEFRALGFDPFRGRFFNILDDLADRDGPSEIEKQVSVVFDGIDEDGSAVEVLQDGGHVGMQRAADGIGDDRIAVLGAEDEVDVQAGKGLGHWFGRPCRALDVIWDRFPGRCPGLAWDAPLGRKMETFLIRAVSRSLSL